MLVVKIRKLKKLVKMKTHKSINVTDLEYSFANPFYFNDSFFKKKQSYSLDKMSTDSR